MATYSGPTSAGQIAEEWASQSGFGIAAARTSTHAQVLQLRRVHPRLAVAVWVISP
jgi:hypothetical protein